MSKIVIDAREYSTSTGRYISNLIKYLEKLATDHDFTVLLQPKDMDSYTPASSNFTKLACPYKEFTFAEQIGFKRQLEALKPDLVHFGATQQPVWYGGKVITTVHDLITARFTNPDKQLLVFKAKQLVYRWVIKTVAKKSTIILTPTQFVKDDLVSFAHITAQKIIVTYEAADLIVDSPVGFKDLQNKKFIMYIGRPTPHKNLGRLLEAFALLHQSRPDLLLVLAGKTDANYRRIAASIPSELQPNVIFTDYISDAQLRWLYEHCAAYVFPSLSEGFGLPGLEAMVHGAPVVASNASCLPEVYDNAAHYFDPLQPAAMAKAINEVLNDSKLRQKLITNGRAQASNYSWTRMAKQTLAAYNKILG